MQTANLRMLENKVADATRSANRAVRLAKSPLEKARALSALGWVLGEQKRYAEGIKAYEDALKIRLANARKPRDIEEMAVQMQQLASLYQKAQRKDDAITMLDKAASEMERAHGADHQLSKLSRQMADAVRQGK